MLLPIRLRFRLGMFLWFVAVLGTSLAAFGGWGIGIVVLYVGLIWILGVARTKRCTPVVWAATLFGSIVIVDFLHLYLICSNDAPLPFICSSIQLRRVGQALLAYHGVHGCFPPVNVTNAKGQPIHSWRALILPYLSTQPWYRYYSEEPWNGVNNRDLVSAEWFHCPADVPRHQADTPTSYVAVIGPGTAWQVNRGVRLKDITDGPEQTALLVELFDSKIPWMEPRDITLGQALDGPDGKASVPTSRHAFPGGYFFREHTRVGNLLMADGTVVSLTLRPSSADMAALLSICGNDHVDIQALRDAGRSGGQFHWDHIFGLPLFLVAITVFWLRLLPKSERRRG